MGVSEIFENKRMGCTERIGECKDDMDEHDPVETSAVTVMGTFQGKSIRMDCICIA